MAYNTDISLTKDTATLISKTGEAITDMRAQNLGKHPIFILGTATETVPTDWGGAVMLLPGIAIKAADIAALFPGVVVARYYGISHSLDGKVSVSHA